MQEVDKLTVYLVSGYIRLKIQKFINDKIIPQEIVDICILYYFITEYFAVIGEGIVCSDDKKTITLPLKHSSWNRHRDCFGSFIADCNNDNIIYKWIIKINNDALEVGVGVIDADKLDEYKAEKTFYRYAKGLHYAYRSNGYIHSHQDLVKGFFVGVFYGSDDVISIKIDTELSVISFYKNEKLIRGIKHIKMVKYRLVAFLWSQDEYGNASITIQDFKMEKKGMKEE